MKKIISFVLLISLVACLGACSNENIAETEGTSALTETSTMIETSAVVTEAEIFELVSGDYAFSVSNGEATVIEFVGSVADRGRGYELVIPEEVEGYPVVAIGDYCFELSISLGSIKIPDSVTKIGVGAFKNCWMLENAQLPRNLTHIEKSAFEECHKLTSIDVPSSVTSIGEKALTSAYGLTVNCSAGSYAEEYAKANGITYVAK